MTEILKGIPPRVELAELKRRLHLRDNDRLQEIQDVVKRALPMLECKAAYTVSYVDKRQEGTLVIDGVSFVSKVLRKNLDQVERVFPYVITIGPGLEETVRQCADVLEQYYLDVVGTVALAGARQQLIDHLRSKYGLDKVSMMSPGSLADWPLEQQRPLFALLGNGPADLGVSLTDTFLMLPKKSVSGICFPAEVSFFSCQLCARERCESRKAAYCEKLAREYGILNDDGH
jgi:hypothetical protein